MKIRALIFDVGDVLIENSLRKFLACLADMAGIVEPERFISLFLECWPNIKTGRMRVDEFCALAGKKVKHADDLYTLWPLAYRKSSRVNRQLLSLIRQWSSHYTCAILSNTEEVAVRVNRELGIYASFDPLVLSCEVGFAKPDPAIYEYLLKRLSMPPSSCIMIDDKQANLQYPEAQGLAVITFRNNQQLLQELLEYGITTDE